jgi:hypothetical protein
VPGTFCTLRNAGGISSEGTICTLRNGSEVTASRGQLALLETSGITVSKGQPSTFINVGGSRKLVLLELVTAAALRKYMW